MSKFKIAFIAILTIFSFVLISTDSFAGGDDPEGGFKVFPTLQVVTPNSVGIMWESLNSDSATISVSVNSNFSGAITLNTSSAKLHKVTVGGLVASTRYYYKVLTDGETSSTKSFLTALPKGDRSSFRFMVYGDSRRAHWAEDIVASYGDNDDHLPVLESMTTYSPDFVLHVGDFVYSGNDMDDIYNFFDVEKNFLGNFPLLAVYGNHEFDGGESTSDTYMDSYLIPAQGPNFAYYSYNYGNVHICVINTGHSVNAGDDYSYLAPGTAQHNFIKADLEAAAADGDIDHIFVALHNPLYSVAGFGDNQSLINSFENVFIANGVKAVFMGHEHDYQHMTNNGIHYILSGGCGSSVIDMPWHGDQDDTAANLIKYDDVLNYVIVDVNGSSVNFQARSVQGNGNSTSSPLESFSL